MELVWLGGLAFLAGFVDAIVGGGGLIQIPALFLFLPAELSIQAVTVLGTNKLASICGTAAAVAQYARRIRLPWHTLLWSGGAAFCLSFAGAYVVSRVPSAFLRPLMLVLLVGVGAYTFIRKDMGGRHAPRFAPRREAVFGIGAGLVIGFYDGFFGPGTGSFPIFIFIGLFGFDFLTASASAKVINLATNLAALLWFAPAGHVLYGFALPMGLCNLLGSLAGARLAMLKGNRFVRVLFLLIVSAIILRFAFDTLARR